MTDAPGSVMSTNAVPFESPMMAYSRPAGDTQPQQLLPFCTPVAKVLSGNHALSTTPLEVKPPPAVPPSP